MVSQTAKAVFDPFGQFEPALRVKIADLLLRHGLVGSRPPPLIAGLAPPFDCPLQPIFKFHFVVSVALVTLNTRLASLLTAPHSCNGPVCRPNRRPGAPFTTGTEENANRDS